MRNRIAFALICGALALGAASPGAQPEVLGGLVAAASNPQLAAAPDGSVHLVYEGRVGGQGVIAHRVWQGGLWGAEEIVSTSDGDQYDPAIGVSGDGTLHVAWSTESGTRLAVAHRSLRSGVWSDALILDAGSQAQSEFPSIAARPDGGAEVVWQAGEGTRCLVMHVSISPNGEATAARPLDCQSEQGFNVYPQVFLTPVPVVCWYEAVDGDFALRAAELVPGPRWARMPFDDLLLITPNRLPIVLLGELDRWAAVWCDAQPQHERIMLGRGEAPDFGLGEIVDANPDFDNLTPNAVPVGENRWAVVWRGETPAGPEVFLAVDGWAGWRQWMLTGGQTLAPAQPAVCLADGLLHVVWTSDVREGGTGELSHIALPLP
jgi:hypothetical protein